MARCNEIDLSIDENGNPRFVNVAIPPCWAHEHCNPSPEPYVCMYHYPKWLKGKNRSDAAKRAVQTKRKRYSRWPANYKLDYVC